MQGEATCRRSITWQLMLLQLLMMLMVRCGVWADSRPKEIETVVRGTKFSEFIGDIISPPGFPDQPYPLDATSYIFVLENIMLEGSVQVTMQTFDIHPKSWLTVRNSKYGGNIGQILGRYDRGHLPPSVISTDTCCIRLEFQTGCCGPPDPQYTGLRASIKFITTPGRGRRFHCKNDSVFTQLCNGECIPQTWDCPCPLYGQYKCENGMCVGKEKLCDGQDHCGDESDELLHLCESDDETPRGRPAGLGAMFTFSVIITTICSMLGFVCVMIFILSTSERLVRRRASQRTTKKPRPTPRCLPYAQLWPRPEVGVTSYHDNTTHSPEVIVTDASWEDDRNEDVLYDNLSSLQQNDSSGDNIESIPIDKENNKRENDNEITER